MVYPNIIYIQYIYTQYIYIYIYIYLHIYIITLVYIYHIYIYHIFHGVFQVPTRHHVRHLGESVPHRRRARLHRME